MSELNTNNRYNEYTYDFYVGFSKNMGEHLSFSASITGEYYKRPVIMHGQLILQPN